MIRPFASEIELRLDLFVMRNRNTGKATLTGNRNKGVNRNNKGKIIENEEKTVLPPKQNRIRTFLSGKLNEGEASMVWLFAGMIFIANIFLAASSFIVVVL